ncbi:hypothetical protein GUJ93_ZPchr0010g8809 [Zizania palustris]|uniref:Uncharacterized protein n=1 Tax=Zizania palustris TaxID=103762 RepID=A0A8J6BLN6_ZIZPA|nr:hypothetical protein GUJ93_ZPchr0010g8809 [Zizania palustris]
MDDILVYSPSLLDHVQHLKQVLSVLKQHNLYAKRGKCFFGLQKLEYLGHIVSADGVSTDPEKTRVMKEWPTPQSLTDLRGFLGLTGYYRKFVRHYGILTKPLTLLLKKSVGFQWTDQAQLAFEKVKKAMCETPVLALPRFDQPFAIETDACDTGVGAVLIQLGHPIAFYSKALGLKNQHLSIYEKEFLAVLMVVDRWRSYLLRGPFTIYTDHKSLCQLDTQVLTSEMQRKAMTKLIGLQYKFQYKKGVDNSAADALSRVGHMFQLQAISGVQPVWLQEVLNSYVVDTKAQDLMRELAITGKNEQGYELVHGLIKHNGKIWIGANSSLQTKLIAAFHSSAVGGHSGMQATYQRLHRLFTWPGLKGAVQDFIRQCSICQQAKHEHCNSPGLLQPLPIPQDSWQDITMDFVEGLPASEGFNCILVIVDRFSKFAHFLPLKHPFSAPQVARVFLDRIVSIYGLPKTIVSDRDKVFTSHFWQNLFDRLQVPLQLSTAYHPQTDGQTERVNQCLEMYLRSATSVSPHRWGQWLPLAQYWYNTCYHTALQCSPYKVLFGRDPSYAFLPALVPRSEDGLTTSDVEQLLQDRHLFSEMLKLQLTRAQHRMKQQADQHRSFRSFQVGDAVYLKLQPYAQSSVANRPYPKLSFKYFGPFEIISRVGAVAYKLKLPDDSLIHPVFHVSQLKHFVPSNVPVFAKLPSPVELDVAELVPTTILDRRLVKKGSTAQVQILVTWGSLPPACATWEDYYVLQKRFPSARIWEEDRARGGGNVTAGVSAVTEKSAKAGGGSRDSAETEPGAGGRV